jgi:hypothetical protein
MRWCNVSTRAYDSVVTITSSNAASAFPQGPTNGFPSLLVARAGVPMAATGNNTVFMAWTNNDSGHWNVFFAKSTDGGKTLKTKMISSPYKGHVVDLNTEVAASGSKVYVTWWTNKTGVLMPLFRASNDGVSSFAKPITLNSTG